ncbi:1-acyl-sn-glycerol-3-phosphate acyltransferase [Loktanella sp. PT4BL]|jgi:1-acyl-sn-glycerol-3-phosphate acyltransferase|uniref:lysophospholipid acyltransferase family protein n=1 Tax=Loktanella sp. PT4BL TaxID=2135611 RepID=UPI000D750F51|nr:lysophospholipid acyltransferase family protein [Loktanella sp. PT4BL]PXW67534.1 1-acyl-sn-glycerol-3-phosphate acyltransferase [Loktanella sp. PT4BL]
MTHALKSIQENWRGGKASLRFLLGTPAAMGRIALGAQVGRPARTPLESLFAKYLEDCRFEVIVEGEIPAAGTGCILSHNETSFADLAAYFVAIWPHVDRLAGADVYRHIPFARKACAKIDIELVARGNRRSTDPLVDRMVAAAKAGKRVGWGGEGRLSGRDGVGRFKVGGSIIAIRAKAPVIPVVIHGGHHAMQLGTVRARPSTIHVRFCKPVSTEHYEEADARDLANKLQQVVSENYTALSERQADVR